MGKKQGNGKGNEPTVFYLSRQAWGARVLNPDTDWSNQTVGEVKQLLDKYPDEYEFVGFIRKGKDFAVKVQPPYEKPVEKSVGKPVGKKQAPATAEPFSPAQMMALKELFQSQSKKKR